MDRRSIIFVLLSTVILFGWIAFFPPIDKNDLVQQEDPAADVPGDDVPAGDGPNGSGTDPTTPDQNDTPPPTDGSTEPPAVEFKADHRLVSLGSLAPDTRSRMLAIFNSRGATIEQIELADRLPSGQFRFKMVDDRAGYLGHLGIQPTEDQQGVRVNVVGTGTPASTAQPAQGGSTGLQVDDLIVAVGQAAITTPAEYYQALNQTNPGEDLQLQIRRDGAALTYTAKLLSRPMKVVQPMPDEQTEWSLRQPESFHVSLGTLDQGVWREISAKMQTADWELVEGTPEDTVSFLFRLSTADLAAFNLVGPITIIKTYRLPQRQVESPLEFDKSFHLEMDLEIRNGGSEPQQLAYSLDGPTGLPDEGWWYINKIHGRSTAVFYTAGARDVIGGSKSDPFTFLGGPEILSNAKENTGVGLSLFPPEAKEGYREVEFVGVDTQYFNVFVLPETGEEIPPFVVSNGYAKLVGDLESLDKKLRKTADVSFRLTSQPITLAPYDEADETSAFHQRFTVFAGPKYPELLKKYNLESTVSYGWFAWFSVPLTWLLHFFHMIVGNYGLSIIMLTLLVRAAMIPISRKAALNAQMMQHLQPEMKRLNEQYKNDMERRAKAQRELFAKYKYNPMGGCLLMFVQLPIFLGLYRGLNVDIALRDQSFIPGLQWCANLAGPDRLFVWENLFPMLTAKTGFLGPYFNILPIITVVLFLVQQKLFMPPAVDEQTKMTQRMMTYMMVFMGVMFFKVPSGLCIYFITSSTWGIIERKLLPKPTLDGKLARLEATGESGGGEVAIRDRSAAKLRIEEQRQRARKRNKR